MKKLLLFLFLIPHLPALAQHPILVTEDALTLGKDKIEVGVGFEYFAKQAAPTPNDPKVLYRVLVIAIHQGVAQNVNFDLDWRGALLTTLGNGTNGFHWGEITVSTRINFIKEHRGLPAIGFRTAVKLPNTRYNDYKLGSNQTDYFSHLLLSKQFGTMRAHANLGFSIVGDPRVAGVQNDIYSLSLAIVVPLSTRARAFIEVLGLTAYQDHSDKLLARIGSVLGIGEFDLGVYGSVRAGGNNRDFGAAFENSEDIGIGLMLKRVFDFRF